MAKAGRPKKGSAGLPEWFDIEKYRAVQTFSAENWFQQASIRQNLFRFVESCLHHKKDIFKGLAAAFNLIKADPILTRDSIYYALKKAKDIKEQEALHNDTALSCVLFDLFDRRFGVGDIRFDMVFSLALSLREDQQLTLSRELSHRLFNPKEVEFLYEGRRQANIIPNDNHPLLEAFRRWKMSVVSIDLSLPDEVLIKEFTHYLKVTRKRIGKVSSPFFKNPDFKNWHCSGVLPYLDLKLWEAATGEAIRWPVFVNALSTIMDNPIGSESAFMKTTKKHADQVMNAQTIKVLQLQALRERSGMIQKSGKLIVR
jgi:hypothetical protein